LHLLDEVGCRRGARAEEAGAEPDRAPDRLRAGAAEPQRWVRLLERFGLHALVLDLPELAVERDPVLRPQGLHQLDALGEAADVALAAHAERAEGAELAARADADLQPSPAELVQAGQAFRQMRDIVQSGHI